MATSFNGWGSSWGQTWDRISDPNAMYGSASITITATGTLTSVSTDQPQVNRYPVRFYAQPIPRFDNSKRLREDDSLLLLLL